MICVPQVYYVGSALEGACVCVFLKPGSSTKGLGVWGVCTVSSMFPGLQCSAEKLPGICWGQSFGLGVSIFLCSSFLMLLSFGISTYHSGPLYVLMIWVLLWVLPSVHHPLSSAAWANLGMPHLEVPSTWCIHGCSVFHPGLWLWHSFILAILLSIARRAWGFWTFVAEPVLWSFHVLAPVVSVSSYGQLIIPAGYLMTGRTNVLMAWILFLMFNWFLSTCLTF